MRPVGFQGEETWNAPLGRLGGSNHLCARGTGAVRYVQRQAGGWRVGDARDLTRSRGFATAGFGARLHLPTSVVEVHVAARRLRRIVPVGIRPNGTIRLRGERPSPGSTRPFELSSCVFYYAQSGSRDSLAQYAVAMPLAVQKTADQVNNPAYLRL